MRLVTAALIGLLSTSAFSKLPPATEEAKAKATEANAKAAWSDKIGQYQLCVAMDRTAETYRKSTQAAGKPVPVPVATPPVRRSGPLYGGTHTGGIKVAGSCGRTFPARNSSLATEQESDGFGNCDQSEKVAAHPGSHPKA